MAFEAGSVQDRISVSGDRRRDLVIRLKCVRHPSGKANQAEGNLDGPF